ncbi:MAG: glucose-1-phosphate cytidylyltransferase [Bacteroidetes bacterium]|nr:glucose-1-phosphate cytidylyltransferase [Bacteroidota bacterium]
MKVVIFAGGMGTRISEESHLKPKPMIEIGGKPLLWHIMKSYAAYGHKEFIVCLGYKGQVIKEYFLNYFYYNSDITVDLSNNKTAAHSSISEDFKVTLVDTGLHTMTAGRLKQVQDHIGDEEFMLTYGDGVADIDINELVKFHGSNEKICTVTAIQPGSRFGIMETADNDLVTDFIEKPNDDGAWINGGFFVLKPDVFKYLKDDANDVMWERQPMEDLAKDGQLVAFKHKGFWKCMDTIRDKEELEHLWDTEPKWRAW